MSIKARITILRMTGPRWVDKISNTQTKCCTLCDYFTVNFSVLIAHIHTVSTLIIWTKCFLIFLEFLFFILVDVVFDYICTIFLTKYLLFLVILLLLPFLLFIVMSLSWMFLFLAIFLFKVTLLVNYYFELPNKLYTIWRYYKCTR